MATGWGHCSIRFADYDDIHKKVGVKNKVILQMLAV
jgi:hypothetical protein